MYSNFIATDCFITNVSSFIKCFTMQEKKKKMKTTKKQFSEFLLYCFRKYKHFLERRGMHMSYAQAQFFFPMQVLQYCLHTLVHKFYNTSLKLHFRNAFIFFSEYVQYISDFHSYHFNPHIQYMNYCNVINLHLFFT